MQNSSVCRGTTKTTTTSEYIYRIGVLSETALSKGKTWTTVVKCDCGFNSISRWKISTQLTLGFPMFVCSVIVEGETEEVLDEENASTWFSLLEKQCLKSHKLPDISTFSNQFAWLCFRDVLVLQQIVAVFCLCLLSEHVLQWDSCENAMKCQNSSYARKHSVLAVEKSHGYDGDNFCLQSLDGQRVALVFSGPEIEKLVETNSKYLLLRRTWNVIRDRCVFLPCLLVVINWFHIFCWGFLCLQIHKEVVSSE